MRPENVLTLKSNDCDYIYTLQSNSLNRCITYSLSDSSSTVYHPKISHDQKSFNPYPLLGAPSLPCWPRGMPLHMVRNEDIMQMEENACVYQNGTFELSMNLSNFAVLQSVADIQPDVDAVFRLIRGTPFSFLRPEPLTSPNIQKGILLEYINTKIYT